MRLKQCVGTVLLLCACNGQAIEEVYSECDPLDPSVCALPFPSSFYEAPADTVTGYQINYGPESLPVNRDFVDLEPTIWNERDGHSIGSPVLVYFDDVSVDGVVEHTDISRYADEDVNTVIINARTGERVPHWVELDGTAPSPDQAVLTLRPAQALEYGTRYVVGFRGLQKVSGGPVESSEAFVALRDDTKTLSWDVEGRRERFESEVFPVLDAQGFQRSELQLAWDFRTASRENTVGRMEWMRDDAITRFEPSGPAYTISSVEENDCTKSDERIYKTLSGTFTAPLYTETDLPGTVLTRDENGMPFYNGDKEVSFLVRIPCSLKEDPEPAYLLQYGHGLLGSYSEVKSGWLAKFIDERKYVVFAVSWTGMKAEDRGAITIMVVNDPSQFHMVPERSMQGLVEQVGAMRLMLGGLAQDAHLNIDGVSLIDPSNREKRGYYGNSQGGIMGGAYLGLSPDVERGVLGVPGMPYSLLLPRSYDFDPFFSIFREKYTDHREQILIIAGLLEQLWDVSEPTAWAWDIQNPPEGMLPKQALLQAAIGDAQVSTLGAQVQARSYGASLVAPETREVWGLESKSGPFTGSALVEWRYTDIPDEPFESVPPNSDFDPHECPRRSPPGQEQAALFLETGTIDHFCDGPCEAKQSTCR